MDAAPWYALTADNRRLAADVFASLDDEQWRVPSLCAGWGGQLADSCIHLRDAARPLHLTASPPPSTWAEALSFLVSPNARRIFVPRGRLAGLALSATDSPFAYGAGAEVSGPGEALALAITGRRVALRDLSGDGVAVLRDRLG